MATNLHTQYHEKVSTVFYHMYGKYEMQHCFNLNFPVLGCKLPDWGDELRRSKLFLTKSD